MICIYCSADTKVTNSRSRSLNSSIWRRRECKQCVAQFSTNELPDYSKSLAVKNSTEGVSPFSRDKLFLSITKALGHRVDHVNEASDLTGTIIAKLIRSNKIKDSLVDTASISKVTYETLRRFDVLAANTYKAYHGRVIK